MSGNKASMALEFFLDAAKKPDYIQILTLFDGRVLSCEQCKTQSCQPFMRTLRYHEWMKCPELQHLTPSEPPTLEQEYDMQGSWREDDDIGLGQVRKGNPSSTPKGPTSSSLIIPVHTSTPPPPRWRLTLKWSSVPVTDPAPGPSISGGRVSAFLTLAISLSTEHLVLLGTPEPSYRGKGIGKEVTHMMMCYSEHLIPSFRRFKAGRQKLKVTV